MKTVAFVLMWVLGLTCHIFAQEFLIPTEKISVTRAEPRHSTALGFSELGGRILNESGEHFLRVTLEYHVEANCPSEGVVQRSGRYVFEPLWITGTENKEASWGLSLGPGLLQCEFRSATVRVVQVEDRIKKSIAERERQAREAAEERRRNIERCRIIYRETADKKIADLTVREAQLVDACKALRLYPPPAN